MLNREGRIGKMKRMVVKRKKQHKGEGQGGWVDIEHCDEDTCITKLFNNVPGFSQEFRRLAATKLKYNLSQHKLYF